MGLWYWLGVSTGLGVGLGAVLAAVLGPLRAGVLMAALGGGAAGLVVGLAGFGTAEAAAGAAGGLIGGFTVARLCRRTIARGGTHLATAAILVLVAIVVAGLAWVPAVGYAEAAVALFLGLRMRGEGGRYAGLRTLARD